MDKSELTWETPCRPPQPAVSSIRVRRRGSIRPDLAWHLALGLCLASWINPAMWAADALSEYQLKAALVYRFATYVEWPEASFPTAESALVIAIVGEDPFGDRIDQVLKGKTVRNHPVLVKRFPTAETLDDCHVVFISKSERKNLGRILESLRKRSVVTIGDFDQFCQRGGLIALHLEGKTLQFELNVDAARRAEQTGLRFNTQLFKLGRSVREEKAG